ncbi:MAG: LamG-like jellyroll fold domain-containing protein, partial [Planctomycetota bacterium]
MEDRPGAVSGQAKALLEEVDARFAKLADAELEKAISETKALAAAGRSGDAEAALARVRERFGGTEWFETRGRQALEAAVEEIARLAAGPGAVEEERPVSPAEEAPQATDATAPGDEAAALREGLIGWWTFDEGAGETAMDSSGSGKDGTLTNMEAGDWVPGGRIDGALAFGNDAEYVSLPALDLSGNVSITFAAWVKVDAAAQNNGNFFGFGRKSRNQVFSFRCNGATGFQLYFWHNDLNVTVPAYRGSWVHVAAVWDSATSMQYVYFNGAEVGSRVAKVMPNFQDVNYRIGGFNNEYLLGQMDDVRIYNRALPVEEVTLLASGQTAGSLAEAMFRSGPAPEVVTEGLVAHWKLDEAPGATRAKDATGSGNDSKSVDGATSGSAGRIGGAWSFDGDDYIAVPNSVINPREGTIAGWVKLHGLTDDWQDLFGTNSLPCRYYLQVSTDGVATARIRDPSFGTLPVGIGEWHHLAVTWVRKGRGILYVDGVEAGSTPNVGNTKAPADSSIGAMQRRKNNDNLNGLADDVRIYNRALSADEVRTLASAPGSGPGRAPGLPAGLKLRDLVGTPSKDGYGASPAVFMELRKGRDAAKVTAKRLATVGDSIAASSSFDSSLRRDLSLVRGYALSRASSLVSKGKTAAQIEKTIAPGLAREKPEVVRICLGLTDLVKETDVRAYGASLDAIVEAVIDSGAAPVLYTLPVIELNPSKQDAKRQTVKAAKAFSDRAK